MTTTYNRSSIFDFSELNDIQQQHVKDTYFDEESDQYSTSYVILDRCKNEPLPLSMFMRTKRNNNFTHGVYSTSAFDGYFITFDRSNTTALIAHKYF